MTYKQFIENKKIKWIGKNIKYKSKIYKIVDVDYNGMLLINKKTQYTNTTAISEFSIEN